MKSFEINPLEKETVQPQDYAAPQIVLEIDLETRAGSQLPEGSDPLDLTGVGNGTELFP